MLRASRRAASIIDTPGIRSFGLAHVRPEDLIEAFPDLDEMTEDCPRGCTHGGDEPECGLDLAVERGDGRPRAGRVVPPAARRAVRHAVLTADGARPAQTPDGAGARSAPARTARDQDHQRPTTSARATSQPESRRRRACAAPRPEARALGPPSRQAARPPPDGEHQQDVAQAAHPPPRAPPRLGSSSRPGPATRAATSPGQRRPPRRHRPRPGVQQRPAASAATTATAGRPRRPARRGRASGAKTTTAWTTSGCSGMPSISMRRNGSRGQPTTRPVLSVRGGPTTRTHRRAIACASCPSAADYTDDLRLAHVLADDADSLTEARFQALDLHVMSKPDLTPVTEADLAVEEAHPPHALPGALARRRDRRGARHHRPQPAAVDRRPDRRHQELRPGRPGLGHPDRPGRRRRGRRRRRLRARAAAPLVGRARRRRLDRPLAAQGAAAARSPTSAGWRTPRCPTPRSTAGTSAAGSTTSWR